MLNSIKNSLVYVKAMITVSLLVFISVLFANPVLAATIADVENNSLRVGNDIYSLASSNLTDDNIANSLATGGNKVFYKFNGKWFDVYAADSDAYWDNPSNALADSVVAAWGTELKKWYKSGNEIVEFVSGGTGTVPDPVGPAPSAIVTDVRAVNSTTVEVVFSEAVTQEQLEAMNLSFEPELEIRNRSIKQGSNGLIATLTTVAQEVDKEYTLKIDGTTPEGTYPITGLDPNALAAPFMPNLDGMLPPGAIQVILDSLTEDMEYRLNGGEWKSIPPKPVLKAEDHLQVRMKETDTSPAGVIAVLRIPAERNFIKSNIDNIVEATYLVTAPIHFFHIEATSTEVYEIYIDEFRMTYEGFNHFELYNRHFVGRDEATIRLYSPFGVLLQERKITIPKH